MNKLSSILVFYDGDCGFCSYSIQFILKNRRHNNFKFVSLQSELAKKLLSKHSTQITMETIYILKNGIVKDRSNAILMILKELKFPYPVIVILYLIPRCIRDYIYQHISYSRHRLRADFCIVPSVEEKKLFLDK